MRQSLADLRDRVLPASSRPTASANLHLTLLFLGSVANEQRGCMEQGAGRLRGQPFELCLDRLGYWAKPRVAWLGPAEVPGALTTLVSDLRQMAVECGLTVESRPYRAHVTLGRKLHRPGQDRPTEQVSWSVRDFVLVRSETLPDGVCYQVIKRWPLSPRSRSTVCPGPLLL